MPRCLDGNSGDVADGGLRVGKFVRRREEIPPPQHDEWREAGCYLCFAKTVILPSFVNDTTS